MTWIDTTEAAKKLGITREGVQKRIRRGALKAKRDGQRWLVQMNGEDQAPEPSEWVTPKEAAVIEGVTPAAILFRMHAGVMEGRQIKGGRWLVRIGNKPEDVARRVRNKLDKGFDASLGHRVGRGSQQSLEITPENLYRLAQIGLRTLLERE